MAKVLVGNFKGPAGETGPKGDTGATPNLTIGTVETLEAGSDATASITGTAEEPVLNLGIPQGEGGGSVQADLAETDETSNAYVKGVIRQDSLPPGFPYRLTMINSSVEELTLSGFSTSGNVALNKGEVALLPDVGCPVRIIWDGVLYTDTAFTGYGGWELPSGIDAEMAVGNPYLESGKSRHERDEFPFLIIFRCISETYKVYACDIYANPSDGDSHTVEIEVVYYRDIAMDARFLPIIPEENMPYTFWAKINQRIDEAIASSPAAFQGWGYCATVTRDDFTEEKWAEYGETGHSENWSATESIRNGCRIGDLFTIVGTSTDGGKAHMLIYRSTTDSATLKGNCEGHLIWG